MSKFDRSALHYTTLHHSTVRNNRMIWYHFVQVQLALDTIMKMLSALANANRSENTKFRWYCISFFPYVTFHPYFPLYFLPNYLSSFLLSFFPYFLLYWITHFHTYLLSPPPVTCIISFSLAYLPYNPSDSSSSELYNHYFHRSIRILNASFQSKVVAVDGGKYVLDILYHSVWYLTLRCIIPSQSLPFSTSPSLASFSLSLPLHLSLSLPCDHPFIQFHTCLISSLLPFNHIHSFTFNPLPFHSLPFNFLNTSSSNSTSLIVVPLISSLFPLIRNANDGSSWVSSGARIGQSQRV